MQPVADRPPVAFFTFSPTKPLSGQEVIFDASLSYDLDGTISSFAWDFGDGGKGSGQRVGHAFAAGIHTVNLTVTDDGGLTASASRRVDVAGPLAASIGASQLAGSLTVSFSSSVSGGTPPYTYAWSFGDGGVSSNPNPTHAYASPGTYAMGLVVIDHEGTVAHAGVSINVQIPPLNAAASANRTSGTAPLTVTFGVTVSGGLPPYGYRWDFDDRNLSFEGNPTHTFDRAGTYTVKVTVTDSMGGSLTRNITIAVGGAERTPTPPTPLLPYYIGAVVGVAVGVAVGVLASRRRRS